MLPELLVLKRAIDEALKHPHFEKTPSKELATAIDYALSSGGKRLRPLLVLAVAQSLAPRQALKLAMPAALAVEYIHTYSLVHDDLPSMDNDDYRRGKLSVHRRFHEGIAILVGDALLADAFFLISQSHHNAIEQCRELARAAGRNGIVAGQVLDISNVQKSDSNPNEWQLINHYKTGKLFACAAILGALSVDAQKNIIESMHQFGRLFGESFQLKDDLDDNQGLCQVMPKHDIEKWLSKNVTSMHELVRGKELLIQLVNLSFS